jgi:rod shape determining protein RodA
MLRFWKFFLSQDRLLLGSSLLLVALGLAMLFSAESSSDFSLFTARFTRQLLSLFFALAAYLFVSFFPYHLIRRYAVTIYLFSFLSLLFTSLAGPIIRGTASRLEIIGFQLQPSEFAKAALIIILSWLFARQATPSRILLILSGLLAGSIIGLIVLEPDIGVAFLLTLLWGGFIVFLGISWRSLTVLGLLAALLSTGAWSWYLADYQKQRLLTFLNPSADPLGVSYNINQSIVALGSGGLLGRGLGHGPQSQLKFLPERQTDFILASLGEELGFVGVCLVTILYGILLWRLLAIASATQDNFGQYLCIGAFLLLTLSFFVSAGTNMGILPVTGIPLPFISYGGSNLVSTFIILGLVQSVYIYGHWVRRPPLEISSVI